LLVIFLSSILQDNLSNVLTEEEMSNLMTLFERHEVMRGKNQFGSCLVYVICVCLRIVVECFCFVCLRLVYSMLPVSLHCSFLIATSVFCNVYYILNRHEVMRGKNELVSLWFRANDNYQRELAVL
jgi:hypothetical protein